MAKARMEALAMKWPSAFACISVMQSVFEVSHGLQVCWFLDTRDRFVDVVRRDFLRTTLCDDAPTRAIRKQNEVAHHVDVLGDALMYNLRP